MTDSPQVSDAPDTPEGVSAQQEPSVQAAAAEVLISEQQVRFATAAAVPPGRVRTGARVAAFLRRMTTRTPQPSVRRPVHMPKHNYNFERARMGRAMDRL